MESKPTEQGFVVSCDKSGTITAVIRSTPECDAGLAAGHSLAQTVPEENRRKVERFLTAVAEDGMALNHEINVICGSEIRTYRFAGALIDDEILVVAARSYNGMTTLIREFAAIGNEQANTIRAAKKENAKLRQRLDADLDSYDEISELNNELVNLHRTLAKKNRELSLLNQMKNRFLGMAAHDLRTPLGNIMILSEFVNEKIGDMDDETSLHVERVQKLSRAMLELVDDLLDVSAIESGEVQLRKEMIDLGALVEASVQMNRHLLEGRGISVEWIAPDPAVDAYVDPGKIDQVITNLLTNAAKYADPGKAVRVSVRLEHEEAVTSVSDEGPGISADHLARLFHPFQTAGTKPSDGQKGTGLGLYIARRIIESHGGRIWAESSLGVGSTFHFSVTGQTK